MVNDLDDLVEECGTFALLRAPDPDFDAGAVGRMAGQEQLLEPSDRRVVAEGHPGQPAVPPLQYPPGLGCPEASSEDVVEGVEVPVPGVVTQQLRELPGEASRSEKFAPSTTSAGSASLSIAMIEV